MARDENVRIFQDTEKRVKEDPGLQEAVKRSVAEQVLIPEMMEVIDLMPELIQNRDRYEQDAEIIVSKKRSYEAAAGYPGERVCVHNFASATNSRRWCDQGKLCPGGMSVPLFYAVFLPEYEGNVGWILFSAQIYAGSDPQ